MSDRRWLHADRLGSVIAVSDASGAALAINAYDEYGAPSSSNAGRFQYTGQMWLPEAGLYHYKARAYAPSLGRFLQSDPILHAGGMNLYAYVGGDPVNARDSWGLFGAPHPDGGGGGGVTGGGFVTNPITSWTFMGSGWGFGFVPGMTPCPSPTEEEICVVARRTNHGPDISLGTLWSLRHLRMDAVVRGTVSTRPQKETRPDLQPVENHDRVCENTENEIAEAQLGLEGWREQAGLADQMRDPLERFGERYGPPGEIAAQLTLYFSSAYSNSAQRVVNAREARIGKNEARRRSEGC